MANFIGSKRVFHAEMYSNTITSLTNQLVAAKQASPSERSSSICSSLEPAVGALSMWFARGRHGHDGHLFRVARRIVRHHAHAGVLVWLAGW